jgi:predicted N-formylglutamate amidohydrolase
MLESLSETTVSSGPHHPAQGGVVILENAGGAGAFVIVCEHASNFIPPRFRNLGLLETDLLRHIAWDPGALGVARILSLELDAPLVACGVSRLVIDCNRDPSVFDAIAPKSEDTLIPGNANLSVEERQHRLQDVYEAFHAGLATVIRAQRARGRVAVVSVHSFTPVYNGVERPWHIGILFDRDESLSAPMLAALRSDSTIAVGANQPYSPGDRVYHTLDRHAQSQGLGSVMIEIRNDLLTTPDQERVWGMKLASVLKTTIISEGVSQS